MSTPDAPPDPTLSLLCVTRADDCVLPLLANLESIAASLECELVVIADSLPALDKLLLSRIATADRNRVYHLDCHGYIECVLDRAIDLCRGDYILRLDDDESISDGMHSWLLDRRYLTAPHWRFRRAYLWGRAATDAAPSTISSVSPVHTFIANPPLWPDYQTRLSTRAMSGGRHAIHAGSPYGPGELAPGVILHHKLLVKTLEEREAIGARYEAIQAGAGDAVRAYSVPELVIGVENFELRQIVERRE